MINNSEFIRYIVTSINKFSDEWLNREQEEAVFSPLYPPTFIVAGPGTGKTTVLSLRVLKHIFVDGINPSEILVTTFTKKAATELKSKILSWGYTVWENILKSAHSSNNQELVAFLMALNMNAVLVGTLDSIADKLLKDGRSVGEIKPTTIEAFVAKGLMRRYGLFPNRRFQDSQLTAYLNSITPHYPKANAFSDKLKVTISLADRFRHDRVDLSKFSLHGPGQAVLSDAISEYFMHLKDENLADFARLEELLLEAITSKRLNNTTSNLKVILVDEFQDTNYLQELIYFELCNASNASLTIVGDDDQSIYRFRGATVDIFGKFQSRIVEHIDYSWRPNRIDLYMNYRSSEKIVSFLNNFLTIEQAYQTGRAPGKKTIVVGSQVHQQGNIPILGIFRETKETLAKDLSDFLYDVFNGDGRSIQCKDSNYKIVRAQNGDFGDAVLLSPKVTEFSVSQKPRLPFLLRNELLSKGVTVFNPRGRSLGEIPEVQNLLGLALQCIDPRGTIQNSITNIKPASIKILNHWRTCGYNFALSNPEPSGLQNFITDWGNRRPRNMDKWPADWPLLDLIFTLVTWFPTLQDDPEGQVYLEAITRTISEVGQMALYKAKILHGAGNHDDFSVREVIREVFEVIATNDISIDEEIMPHIPRSTFPIMTIHQAKGLEFPLTIVDVGSDFRTNSHAQKRFRFPDKGDNVHFIEDAIAPFQNIHAAINNNRTGLQRAMDDLRRLYFVAFSRAENVLILAGLTSQIRQKDPILTVALGDVMEGNRSVHFIPCVEWNSSLPSNYVALI